MINTLKHAALLRNCHIHGGDTGPVASSHRRPTQRHPVRLPRRLSGALRQHSARRRGFAAMPAEKHVEPLIRLPERGARSRTHGGAQGGDGASSSTQGWSCSGGPARCRNCEARNRGAGGEPQGCGKHDRQQADRCAGCCDPQRMPLRLSEGLRRRADRRRACTAMPGKEQSEGFGVLRAGCQRGQWRCRTCGGCGSDCKPGSSRRCACGHCAAADAAARRIIRPEVGMQ